MGYRSTDIKNIIAEIIEDKKEKGGVKSLYFVGCGGSLGALYPAKTFMETESADIKCALISSNEFVHCTPKDFGENSIICLSCHKGNTPETIAAAKLGKEMGASVIILTWLAESEIVEFGDYIVQYEFDASPDHLEGNIDYAGEKTMCALLVAVETLQQTAGYENYDKFYAGVGMISNIIKNARKHVKREHWHLLKSIKMILSFIQWEVVQVMAQHIWKVSVFLWRCSGWIPAAFTQVNSSMDHLRSQMQTAHL